MASVTHNRPQFFTSERFYGHNHNRFFNTSGNNSSSDGIVVLGGVNVTDNITSHSTRYVNSSGNNSSSDGIVVLGGVDVTDNITSGTNLFCLKNNYINNMNDKYHREDERLKTFDQWPLEWMDKNQLAQTGMFYTGEDDKVKCYFCEVEIGRWELEDEPVPEHLRWSPNCPLLRRRTTNNVPISSEALDRLLPPVSYDICGANEAPESHPVAYTEGTIPASAYLNAANVSAVSSAAAANLANGTGSGSINNSLVCNAPTGSSQTYFPEYPEYAIESARLRTFGEWPRIMKQKPHQLAEAGFFYTGSGDRVKCFSCGGGLKDWDDNDEPWEQHALWLSKCRFLKLMKGQTYIDSVIANQKSKDDEEASIAQATAAAEAVAMDQSSSEEEIVGATALLKPTGTVSSYGADVAPQTTAVRIFDKIVACDKSVTGGVAGTAGADICERKVVDAAAVSIPEEKLCKICYAGEYNTAFLPCGHVVACAKCASSVTKCPLCRKSFTDVMRVYFS